MLADAVLELARDALNDADDGTWALNEKIRLLNQGQLLIADVKHDALATTEAVLLVAGTRQTCPANRTNGLASLKFIKLIRNMGIDGLTAGPPVLPGDLEVMNRLTPSWHEDTARRVIRNYLWDPNVKNEYYVWPPVPSSPAVYVELRHLPTPVGVPLSTDKPRYIAEHHTISIPDDFAQLLVDYICWRSYAKADDQESEQKAAEHKEQWLTGLGMKLDKDATHNPTQRVPYQRQKPDQNALRG